MRKIKKNKIWSFFLILMFIVSLFAVFVLGLNFGKESTSNSSEKKILNQFICLDGLYNAGLYYSQKYNFSFNKEEHLKIAQICEKIAWDDISYPEQSEFIYSLLD